MLLNFNLYDIIPYLVLSQSLFLSLYIFIGVINKVTFYTIRKISQKIVLNQNYLIIII